MSSNGPDILDLLTHPELPSGAGVRDAFRIVAEHDPEVQRLLVAARSEETDVLIEQHVPQRAPFVLGRQLAMAVLGLPLVLGVGLFPLYIQDTITSGLQIPLATGSAVLVFLSVLPLAIALGMTIGSAFVQGPGRPGRPGGAGRIRNAPALTVSRNTD